MCSRAASHLLGLINAVLDLSKIEAGRLTLSLADYAMQDVVQTVVTAVEVAGGGEAAGADGQRAPGPAARQRRRPAAQRRCC